MKQHLAALRTLLAAYRQAVKLDSQQDNATTVAAHNAIVALEPLLDPALADVTARQLRDCWNAAPDMQDKVERLAAQNDKMRAALRQAKGWIEAQMQDKGWPRERIENPPEGSHLHAINTALGD